jgi:hypothetical protein
MTKVMFIGLKAQVCRHIKQQQSSCIYYSNYLHSLGFGTGSTQQSWNVEQALLKQKSEEENVTVLLQVELVYNFF